MTTQSPLGSAIFVGTSAYAVPVLEALARIMTVSLVITKASDPAIGTAAQLLNLPCLRPARIQDVEKEIRELAPTLMLVGYYGQIIPQAIIDIPTRGSINVHPSLLPLHRGPAPVPTTILAGDAKTGTTIIEIDSKMDHGPVLAQREIELVGNEFADDLLKQLWDMSAEMISVVIPDYLENRLEPQAQDDALATTHGFMKREDGQITPNMSVDEIWKKHRAYRPWPGTWIDMTLRNKNERLKLLALTPSDIHLEHESGKLLWHSDRLYLAASDGLLEIQTLQRAGSPAQSAEVFYRGFHDVIEKK